MSNSDHTHEGRRRLLRGALCATMCAVVADPTRAAGPDAAKLAPQQGDELCFASYEHDGRLVQPADLEPGAAPLLVYPRDPASGVIRERSRINQILLLRLTAEDAAAAGLDAASEGVIAFSGICTHAACAVSEWNAELKHVVCPCHASEYDLARKAKVVSGPAPRALPSLPVARRDDRYVIAGPFSGAVGAPA
jgi:rieske iron-sulfur protein